MDQANAEERATEAAAEEQLAAALALERAELVKQARSLLCMCGDRDLRTALACFCHLCVQQTAWSRFACHARGGVGNGDGDKLQCTEAPFQLMMPC